VGIRKREAWKVNRVGFRGKLAIDAVAFVAYLAVTNTKLTGIPVHEWLSVGVTLVLALHVAVDWDYTMKVLRNFIRKLLSVSRLSLVVDLLLFVVITAVMLSGFLVSRVVVPTFGLSVPFGPTWRILHSLTATLALPVLGVHVGLHWRWIVEATRRTLASRPAKKLTAASTNAEA
jgi:hypothetical protein